MANVVQRFGSGVYGVRLADGVTWVHAVSQMDSTGAVVNPGQAPGGTPTDRSVTIGAANTAQTAAAANAARHYLFIQNPSGSGGSLWVSWITTAVQAPPSIEILAGSSYENPPHFCPVGAVSVIHSVLSAKITVLEG